MKVKYQRPYVKVRPAYSEDLLATSPTISGDTGIGIGEGDPPSTGNAKHDSGDNSANSGLWED